MMLSMFLLLVVVAVLLYVSVFVVLPLSLAVITQLRWWNNRHSHDNNDGGTSDDDDDDNKNRQHCLCLGRVWHTRFLPKVHAFTYPIFMFAIDLSSSSSSSSSSSESPGNNISDESDNDNNFNDLMWPLSYLVTFRPQIDHLKNGEGLDKDVQKTAGSKDASVAADSAAAAAQSSPSLQRRVFNLVSERTNYKFVPTPATHRVVLLTHLCYYGYNFNPVSFYYVVRKKNGNNGTARTKTDNNDDNDNDDVHDDDRRQPVVVDAMVGEVSNTPWNEMYCYVLHPASADNVQVTKVGDHDDDDDKKKKNKDATATTTTTTTTTSSLREEINYVFHKSFHVSPFMEMDYLYDWSFIAARGGITFQNNNTNKKESGSTTTTTSTSSNYSVAPLPNNSITVLNSLKRPRKQPQTSRQTNGGTSNKTSKNTEFDVTFRAKLELDCFPITSPVRVAYQIIRFPIYCFIIQIWIHWEAVWLFVKGVVYVPHPDESETTVSKIIATIMIPFFAIRDMTNPQSQTATARTATKTNEKKES